MLIIVNVSQCHILSIQRDFESAKEYVGPIAHADVLSQTWETVNRRYAVMCRDHVFEWSSHLIHIHSQLLN